MKGTRHLRVIAGPERNIFIFFVIFLVLILISCSSGPAVPDNDVSSASAIEEKPADIPEIIPEETEEVYKVSEAFYVKTFTDIESLIDTLNLIIKNSRFDEWKKYLTVEYLNYYSSQENLNTVSENPILKKYKIVLRSLMDYFRYVVVPSRSDVHLDEISFVDDNKVIAYMIIDGAPVVLYTLVNVNGQWKIGL